MRVTGRRYNGPAASSRSMDRLNTKFFGQYYNYQPEKRYIHEYGVIYCFELKNKTVLKVIKEELYQNATIYLDRKYKQALNIEY